MTPSAAGSLSNAPTKPVCSESPGPVRKEPDHFYGTFPQRRRPSKSYGDLSNLRPRSPPSYVPQSQHKGLRLSPGKYIEDTPLEFYTDVVSSVQTEQMQIAPSATFVGGEAEAGPSSHQYGLVFFVLWKLTAYSISNRWITNSLFRRKSTETFLLTSALKVFPALLGPASKTSTYQ